MLSIVGKIGSAAKRLIQEGAELSRYNPKSSILINYGLSGDSMENFFRKNPRARSLPMINKFIGCSKYKAVQDAVSNGILAPETKLSAPNKKDSKNWLIKRHHSIGGIGIKFANEPNKRTDIYYQKFIDRGPFEIRVHICAWMEQPFVCKRTGDPKVIAWNFHNGGHFQSVRNPQSYKLFQEAIETSKKILKIRNMAFGAVDFLVGKDGKLYFIEINSAPGFNGLSNNFYINAFSALKKLSQKEQLTYCNR
jgi:hypothetical protein